MTGLEELVERLEKASAALSVCRSRLIQDLEEIRHLRGWLSPSELRERASQDDAADDADEDAIHEATRELKAIKEALRARGEKQENRNA